MAAWHWARNVAWHVAWCTRGLLLHMFSSCLFQVVAPHTRLHDIMAFKPAMLGCVLIVWRVPVIRHHIMMDGHVAELNCIL